MKAKLNESVKNRMLKTAAKIWGVSINEIETSFDPVVSLLISSCASEISKIHSRLNESHYTITEKLIELMTPETTGDSKPAHAILYVNPQDSYVNLNSENLFYYKKKDKNSVNSQNIFFSPVQDFKLVRADVKYLVCRDLFKTYNQSDGQTRKSININDANLSNSTILLGIESDLKFLELNNVSFYFHCDDIEHNTSFYNYLKHSKWSINNHDLEITSGFYNSDCVVKEEISSIFDNFSDKSKNIDKQTLNFYQKFYITIKDKRVFKKSKKYNEVEEILNSIDLKMDSNITWIKIVFPEDINNKTLQSIFASLNATPVLNKELKSFSYQLRNILNIIPVNSDGYFFDIKSITNTNGMAYQLKNKNVNNDAKGTYYVRRRNIGKLDYRNAKDYLIYMIELLKEESASFSFMNHDFLHANLNSLNQQISLIEDKLSNSNANFSDTNYIFLEPHENKEVLLIEYWSTNGEDANEIKPGSDLEVYKAIGVKQKGNYLLTSSFEGKSSVSLEERLNAHRSSLLSRDRIVTVKDIEALCFELYNDKITNVKIRKTYQNNIELKKGITNCISIQLTANKNKKISATEWDLLNTHLQLNLKNKSMNVFPYIIEIV
ncbi:MAG: type VI secretion system baseplate subunit TssF [Flavobacteriaceae bacterium]|nr:type VI secretion system baseplate subunit TssF [Flavobacteriaceae bacterium]